MSDPVAWKVGKKRDRWFSKCGRFKVIRRPGNRGCFVHVYDAHDGAELFATRAYASDARQACQLRKDGTFAEAKTANQTGTPFVAANTPSAASAESTSYGEARSS